MSGASTTTAAHEWSLWTTTARLVVTDPAVLPAALGLAGRVLDDVERAASRFRADSEVRTLVRDADGGADLSPVLADLVGEALWAAELTDGAVDPTLGRAMDALGYDRDLRLVRDDGPLRAVLRRAPGWRSLRLEGRRLTFPAGLGLDLGASAKAVAADRIAAEVTSRLGTGVLVSLGGDVATAGPAPLGGWQVLVQDTPADPVAHLALSGGAAVATSSTVRRTWQRGGRTLHHVLDPATGQPVPRAWRTVSVLAGSCGEANALSTGALVQGAAAARWLRGHGHAARLVDPAGRVVLVGPWPREQAA